MAKTYMVGATLAVALGGVTWPPDETINHYMYMHWKC